MASCKTSRSSSGSASVYADYQENLNGSLPVYPDYQAQLIGATGSSQTASVEAVNAELN